MIPLTAKVHYIGTARSIPTTIEGKETKITKICPNCSKIHDFILKAVYGDNM